MNTTISSDIIKKLLTTNEYEQYLKLKNTNTISNNDMKTLQGINHKIRSRYQKYTKNKK